MKNCILDTSVLIYSPEALLNFKGNNKVLPITTIEELDGLKGKSGEVGVNARKAIKIIDEAINNDYKCGDGTLQIVVDNVGFKFCGLRPSNDNYILGVAKKMAETEPDTILVTKDVNLRIKAASFGINAEDYRRDYVESCSIGNIVKLTVDSEIVDGLFKKKVRGVEADFLDDNLRKENQCFILRDANCQKSVLARYNGGSVVAIKEYNRVYDIRARNCEQKFALDMLGDDNLDCVIISGCGGSGKSLLTMASGMESLDTGTYDRMVMTKIIKSIGDSIGLLPGSKDEKLAGWFGAFFDNLELLLRKNKVVRVQDLIDKGKIELESLEFLRGRSIMNRYVVVDEVQNCEPDYLKTIVSRIGSGSKLVMLGDPSQIDHPMLSEKNNGLTYAMEKLSDCKNVGILQLHKSERSALAQLAVDRL